MATADNSRRKPTIMQFVAFRSIVEECDGIGGFCHNNGPGSISSASSAIASMCSALLNMDKTEVARNPTIYTYITKMNINSI